MKPKILIVSHALELGGAEKSLIGLLWALDPQLADIDLFLYRHEGELMQDIPEYVRLLPSMPAYTTLARPMKDILCEGHVLLTMARLFAKGKALRYCQAHGCTDGSVELEYSHKYTNPLMPSIQPGTVYDLAVSFLTPHYFVRNKVQAKTKIAWIHTDYKTIEIDVESELQMWKSYDRIVSISEAVTDSFLEKFPSLQPKIVEIENILPMASVKNAASAFAPFEDVSNEKWKLLSVGRYCYPKNFDSIPQICSLLKKRGIEFCWYVIGYGPDEGLIQKKIKEFNVEDCVVLLGKKANPYPYIAQCDVYLQPSRFEGKSVAVREAQMLAKPVVITNYETAKSQVKNGIDGFIVSLKTEQCAREIGDLLLNPVRLETVARNCLEQDYSNASEVEKIYALMGIRKSAMAD